MFVAVPVGVLPEAVRRVLAAAPADCVVTDVGSTKRAIVAALEDSRFVGGHPLAGAETSGVRHARADLFEGATWYLTPTSTTSGILYERLHRLLHGLGARPTAIDAETHDTILATVSHLPHVLANVLVSQAARTLATGGERLPATGPSFRDATRVAGAPSAIWTDIYISNRDALAARIDDTIARLTDSPRRAGARQTRRSDATGTTAPRTTAAGCSRRSSPAARCSSCARRCRTGPGVVAQLALELGRAGVNITDMALYPAPDMSEGVVALWIAGEHRRAPHRGARRPSSDSRWRAHEHAVRPIRAACGGGVAVPADKSISHRAAIDRRRWRPSR